jgi:hypothetical protein
MFLDPDDMWNADATRCWRRNQRSGLVQKRKLARKRAGEASLPEVLDRLELALIGMPDRAQVCKALSEVNRRLGSVSKISAGRTSRPAPARRRDKSGIESLSLFS